MIPMNSYNSAQSMSQIPSSTDSTENNPLYFEGLNAMQRAAVEALDGPVLVLAGAGTGKTRVLTTRLAHLVNTGRAYPSQILAVTFTNKAANEMKERVSRLLNGMVVEGWALGTFHALAARMLRRHAELVGLTPSFTILDMDDCLRLIKQILETRSIDVKKNPPKVVLAIIERWKDRAINPGDVSVDDAGEYANRQMRAIYADYQMRLKAVNACDFGDLLLHMITILKDPANNVILSDYHRRFRYIMVDEYQDTNVAQYMWLRLLARGSNNICCVGDDDQSIYGWRGAEVGNILRFEKDFPQARIIKLEQNYRSTGHILAAASAVIGHNDGRLGKTLWSDVGEGEKLRVCGVWDGEAEARFIGEDIEKLSRQKTPLRHIAILVRAGFQMREFEERFIQMGLTYRVFGGPRFYERQEIRDALAYFRVVVQAADDLAFERILNTPKRGIGDATLKLLHEESRMQHSSLAVSAQQLCARGEIKGKSGKALGDLLQQFEQWRSLLGGMKHTDLASQILEESGYLAMLHADKTPEAQGRIENLKELITGLAEFESLPAFLEHIALVLENQSQTEGQDYVSLMTLHGAKGLEFQHVYLPGWEEGLFPSQKSMDENGLRGLEEERRLAYVGITRAREFATITYAANRRRYGDWVSSLPSRFVDELPEDHILTAADKGLYKSGRSHYWDSSGFDSKSELLLSDEKSSQFSRSNGSVSVRADSLPKSSQGGLRVGDRIVHATFGEGKVIHTAGSKLDIRFKDGTTKRLMESFVTKIN